MKEVDCLAGFCHCRVTTMQECAYACVLPSFVRKWNKNRSVNSHFVQVRYKANTVRGKILEDFGELWALRQYFTRLLFLLDYSS